ncbi:1972_t:CDS:2, partial [Cetraspora pellucida]
SSWASYAVNRYFIAGIQSTQHAENSNKVIKAKLSQSSQLVDVVNEIQAVFNQQAERAIVSKYKNEIPTKGMPNIIEEYFSELNKLLHDYLSPQIFQKQCDQMSQSLCYDACLVNNWTLLLEKMVNREDDYNQSQGKENDYDQLQALFLSLVDNISDHVLKCKQIEPTSFSTITIQLPCKYQKDDSYFDKVDEFINYLEKFIKIMKGDLERQQKNINDNKYLDIDDPICVRHKRHQPNHYKSRGKGSSKKKMRILHDNMANQILSNNDSNNELNQNISDSNSKYVRHCYKCKQAGHYAPTCLNS